MRRNIEPETVKRQLYKYTSLESSFGFNSLAIVENKPRTCSLKDFLENFLKFREHVVIKKTKFNLNKAEERAHVLIGLSVSVENIDKVIKLIRSSKNPEDAKNSLLKTKWKINKSSKLIKLVNNKNYKGTYSLSNNQVISILELRLQKLTALGIGEIENEIKDLSNSIINFEKILFIYHNISEKLKDCEGCNTKNPLVKLPTTFRIEDNSSSQTNVGHRVRRAIEEYDEDLKQEKQRLKEITWEHDK